MEGQNEKGHGFRPGAGHWIRHSATRALLLAVTRHPGHF